MSSCIRAHKRWASKFLLATVLGLNLANPTQAFFFAPLPLDSRTPEPSLVPEEKQAVVNPDWIPPSPDAPDGLLPPNEFPPGGHVPEPATGVAAAIGLAIVGMLRRRR